MAALPRRALPHSSSRWRARLGLAGLECTGCRVLSPLMRWLGTRWPPGLHSYRGKKGPQSQPPPLRRARPAAQPARLTAEGCALPPASFPGRPFTSCVCGSGSDIGKVAASMPGAGEPSLCVVQEKVVDCNTARRTRPAQLYCCCDLVGKSPYLPTRETRTSMAMRPLVPGPGPRKLHHGSFPGLCRLHPLPAPLQPVTGKFREAGGGSKALLAACHCTTSEIFAGPRSLQG